MYNWLYCFKYIDCRASHITYILHLKLMPICEPVSCVHSSGNQEHIGPICIQHTAYSHAWVFYSNFSERICVYTNTEIQSKTISLLLCIVHIMAWVKLENSSTLDGRDPNYLEENWQYRKSKHFKRFKCMWLMALACCSHCHNP